MNDSNGFQTGGIVLLAMSIVFCGLAFSLILPMINASNQPQLLQLSSTVSAATEPQVLPKIAESYQEFFRAESPSSVAVPNTVRATNRTEPTAFATPGSTPSPAPAVMPQHVRAEQPPLRNNRLHPSEAESTASTTSTAGSAIAPFRAEQQYQSEPVHFETSLAASGTFPATQGPVAAASIPEPTQPTQPAPVFAAPQMPAGSVYAPVTVNFDSSMFAEQTRYLEQRLQQFESKSEAIAQRAEENRLREQETRLRERQRDERDEDLQRIGQNFEELVKSFRDLQNQTNQSLQQVSAQADQGRMAAEAIEAYKRALSLEEERRREILEASRVAVAMEIQKFASQQQQQFQQLQMQQPPVQHVPAQQPAAQTTEVPAPLALPQPMKLPDEPTSSIVTPDSEIRMQASSISRARVISPPAARESMLMNPRTVEQKKPQDRSTSFYIRNLTGMQKAVDAESSKPQRSFESFDDKPLEVTTPSWQLLDDEEDVVVPLRVPTEQESASLSPVVEPDSRRVATPVAYANTYRFKMEVSSADGQHRVVPVPPATFTSPVSVRDEPAVSQRPASSGVRQTSAESMEPVNSTVAPAANPSGNSVKQSKDLRRDTRNAGRGMNKNFGAVQPGSTSDDNSERKSGLKLNARTLTTEEDEPSLIHRMSSSIRQLGRSLQ